MNQVRGKFVRTAFTFALGMMLWAVPPAIAGTANDAALVMDAESGRVLYARSGDALRSPASLTKMMTLYILFDYIKAGRLGMNDEMTVSSHAASQDPSKLGLKKGDTLTVQDAIYALVIKSANDAAVVVAEHIGGSESRFAAMMTQRARDIGMRRTTYRNASGLPDAAQLTTARDLAILSRSIMRNHPRMFEYFRATSFTWKGKTIKTHNRVLTSLNGANGIKTGYTKASGFNLTTSAERNGKRLIGVVLGGDSWALRDAEMKTMLEAWFAQLQRRPNLIASYGSGGASTVAEIAPTVQVAAAVAEIKNEPAIVETKTMVAMAPIPDEAQTPVKAPGRKAGTKVAHNVPTPAVKPVRVASVEPKAKTKAVSAKTEARAVEVAEAKAAIVPVAKRKAKGEVLPLSTLTGGDADSIATLIDAGYSGDASKAKRASRRAGDWGIQIGAFDSRKAASAELQRARKSAKAKLAKAADGVTSVTNETGRTFYRARFTDFEHDSAEAACKALKAQSFKCVTFSTSTADAS